MKNLPLLIITIVGTLALIIGVAVVFSNSANKSQTVDRSVVEGNPHLVKGPDTAKVTVVEFSDFECPSCQAVYPLIKQLEAQYPNDVKIIYRYYPLVQIHPYAQLAAQAAEVANQQGKFWEMHDLLFEHHDEWAAKQGDRIDQQAVQDKFAGYAEQLGIDKATFTEKIQSDSVKQAVAQEVALGTQLKVDATPTIYINGQKLSAPDQLLPTVAALLK